MRLLSLVMLAAALPQQAADPAKPPILDLSLGSQPVTSLTMPFDGPYTLRLMLRAPSSRYRVEVSTPGDLGSSIEVAPARPIAASGDPSCSATDALVQRALRATDEAEAASAIPEFPRTPPCPAAAAARAAVLRELLLPLPGEHALSRGQQMKVTVSRFTPAGAVARSWTFHVTSLATVNDAVFSPRRGAPPLAAAGPAPPPASWAFRTESQWLVAEVARDVAEMLVAGAKRALPDDAAQAFTVAPPAPGAGSPAFKVSARVDGKTAVAGDVFMATHVWDPAAYAAWAQAVQQALGAKAAKPAGGDAGSALAALLDPQPKTLARENQRISALLNGDARSASAHEQAALLLGAFGLREAAGDFSDVRRTLCRMAAHLTVAAALRGPSPPSADGAIAAVVLDTLVGRQRAALAALDRESAQAGLPPAGRAWVLALRMRNTGDFRLLTAPRAASLLERRESFRARKEMQRGLKAMEAMEGLAPEPIADWGRIILEGSIGPSGRRSLTVEEGGQFAGPAVKLEVAESAAVLNLELEPGMSAPLAAQLKALPGRAVQRAPDGRATLTVIDRGTWAAAGERHLLAAAQANAIFLGQRLAVATEAAAFRDAFQRDFEGLPLYPFFERSLDVVPPAPSPPGATAPRRDTTCTREMGLIQAAPERVTAALWSALGRSCVQTAAAQRLVPPETWFSPALPFGTAYDATLRIPNLGLGSAAVESALALAPYDASVIRRALAARHGSRGPGTLEQLKAAWGALLDYNDQAILAAQKLALAASAHPLDDELKLCQADADRCLGVADELYLSGREEDGAGAYQRAFDGAHDRVRVSQRMDFLVDYYFDRGDVKRAEAIADSVASVYSAGGLRTRARLFARMQRYAEAAEWYRKADERYEGQADLALFYFRTQRRLPNGPFKAEAAAAERQLFPGGIVKVTLQDFVSRRLADQPSVPVGNMRNGVLAPLKLGSADRILAVDGIRVSSGPQFFAVRGLSDDPDISMIIQRKQEYLEVKGAVRRTLFGPARPPAAGK